MVYYMPGETAAGAAEPPAGDRAVPFEDLTPRQIVAELDRYIVGQARAKRAVAIALRNRVRRLRLPAEMAEEVAPKNIIMIGPTGVGKTEIARRLARLARSPFMKVEATKFTEVGYVGRDVESMIRDLTEIAIDMVRQELVASVRCRAAANVEERLLALLLPPRSPAGDPVAREAEVARAQARDTLRRQLSRGELDDRTVELEVAASGGAMPFKIFSSQGMEEVNFNLKDMMPGMFQGRPRRRKLPLGEAREVLMKEEEEKLIDMDQVTRDAVRRVEQSGIVFLDEIDKVAGRGSGHGGPDVSREGVQRDLLPIIEGTTVNTKHGMVRTDHILFIASGAFHMSKPSDLMPELQGRFPIRVELDPLGRNEFVRILTEPENALVKQYVALMRAEGVDLSFTEDAVEALADFAALVNERTENIGARRLQTIMERVLDEILFEGSDLVERRQAIDAGYVRGRLADIAADQDLSRYIL
ncbi:MAG TPA: ATP-dependent protease ATPase subunit HslU [Candidatus Polarisedimenticolia bacterium]|nr:ATP-dependent protease ATPase subunit HslU [Candidatus Polarisedimenticolia bacterium]